MKTYLADAWSATDFRSKELDGYAEIQLCADVRQGVQVMALLSLGMQICMAVFAVYAEAGSSYLYTALTLSTLSLHVLISAKYVEDIKALQMLGMVLLMVTALALSFLAHRTGDLHVGMIAGVILLFISIPLVPWALREATIVIGLTYGLLIASLMSVPGRFESEALVSLQLMLAGAAIIVCVVIARNTFIRKQDIRTQFDLERAHKEMEILSMKDHLTGAWNRRFLDHQFPKEIEKCCKGKTLHVAVLDIDDFKGINDRFGHHVGDDILRGIGENFIDMLGKDGWLIRLGGDEFQIFYCGDDLKGLIGIAVEKLHDMPEVEGVKRERTITLSAGFTSARYGESLDLDALYKAADEALYSSKQSRTENIAVSRRTGSWRI